MRKTLFFIWILFSLPLWSTPSSELEAKIDKLMARYSGANTPGASVAIFQEEGILFAKAYGLRDLETQAVTSPQTNYRIASLTKAFTATAIMQLVEGGLLKLDTNLKQVFPSFGDYGRNITVRHLLTHTSGIRDYETLPFIGQITDQEVLALLGEQKSTDFIPGSRFRYSNSGYVLLACIVEAVSHLSFQDYLAERIFKPLKMDHTIAFVSGVNNVSDRAYGYSPSGSGFVLTDQSKTSATLGDGGIYSSLEDLFQWYRMWVIHDSVLRPETLELMTTPADLNSGKKTEYGFGWFLDKYKGTPKISHTGSTIGQKHALSFFPKKKLGIVVLVNRENAAPWETIEEITRLVF